MLPFKSENERKQKILGSCQVAKNQREMRVSVIPFADGALETVPKDLRRRLEELEIGGRIETTQISTLKISNNTQKSPGYIRKLAISLTLVKNHKLWPAQSAGAVEYTNCISADG